MRRKSFCEKKSVAVRPSVYSLDSKRLSHEGLISAASQFCRRIKQQCEGKIGQKNKRNPLKWAYSTVCSRSWEWFLWTSVWERWVFLGLWLSSMLFRSSLGQGPIWADGAGGLPPSNTGARCVFREHHISCEHPSLRKRVLDICLHMHVAVLEFAGEQLPAPEKLLFPLSTACSRWQISTLLATDTISK